MEKRKVYHLVADSGAFIRNADLYQLGATIYTCHDVVSEIRDKETRRRLAALPFELVYKNPSPKSVQKITEISKQTGDYSSLSHTDIKVLALTYELTCQHEGSEIVNENVQIKSQISTGKTPIKENQLLGFYMPKNDENFNPNDPLDTEIPNRIQDIALENLKPDQEVNEKETVIEDEQLCLADDNFPAEDEGWITPAVLKELKKETDLHDEPIKVACLTTDFAMQNVLIQTNLHLISVDGIQIKSARSYILRCHACFATTKCMEKVFCPKCGNKTLKRVPVEIQEDGSVKMFFSRNPKVLNPRGLRYSLPTPQGGKHANNPLLCEDQRFPHNRPNKKALQKTDVWQDDYDCFSSPFTTNEVNSKAFRLGTRAGLGNRGGRRNPNAVGRKFVKKK